MTPDRDALARIRTLLFAPADDARKCAKAWASGADAVILDLEDAVAPAAKADARAGLAALLGGRAAGVGPLAVVRVNAPGTPDGARDLAALDGLPLDAVMVPKAAPASLAPLAERGLPAIALVETAAGVLAAEQIARAPATALLMLGPVDLVAELGCEPSASGEELLLARSALVLASAAAGLPAPVDGPCLELADEQALRVEALRARRLGFGAKACIHPRQLAAVREAFAPTAAQLAWAARVVDAWEAAQASGSGVVALDGQMVDVPVARRAQALLARG